MRKLPDGWEILLACALLGRVVKGKVRLQKVISEMQRIGLPVNHLFIIHKMGPYSTAVEECAFKADEEGLIKIYRVSMGENYEDRFDYALTGQGIEMFKKEVLPIIKEEFYFLWDDLMKIREEFSNFIPQTTIVDKIHKKLFLEDNFSQMLNKTIREYEELDTLFSEEDYGYCTVWIALSGLSELTLKVLKNIEYIETFEKSKFLPEDAGKYLILSNAVEGLKLFSENYPLEECKRAGECVSDKFMHCKKLELEIRKVFRSINHLSKIYNYRIEETTEEGEISLEDLLIEETE